jgi:peptidoglycan hydrolase-like protein with peptidoglycan-binding domain
VRRPGSYRARAAFDDAERLRGTDATARRHPRLPALEAGAHGLFVRLLEQRLRRLHYHLTGVNGGYDYRTTDAVRAFNKVQGRARVGSVMSGTWRSLAQPRRPRPRSRRRGFHIEIDQSKQVLYTVRAGKIAGILHTSTGRGGITRDGVWHVFRKVDGYSPGRLYYPSYFDGLRAIHGWPDVPTSAASHGCARVPMWAAQWIFKRAANGTEVRIYHS